MYRGRNYDPYIEEINRPYINGFGVFLLILMILAFAVIDPLLIKFMYFNTFVKTQVQIDYYFWIALSGFVIIFSICICLLYALWVLRNLYNDYHY